jgi:hypothetical protein
MADDFAGQSSRQDQRGGLHQQPNGLSTAEEGNAPAPYAVKQQSSRDAQKTGSLEGSFDYSRVDPSVARFLRGQAERIRRQSATTVLQVGSALLQAKRYLSHGNFLIWVEAEVGITARTAQLYMRAAVWSSTKGKVVEGLPLSLVYLLSAPTTPAEFADAVVDRLAAGQSISPSNIRRELKELSEAAKKPISSDSRNDVAILNRDAQQIISQDGELRAVRELIAILARELPKEQFKSVRNVLKAIDHSELATIVANAFSTMSTMQE